VGCRRAASLLRYDLLGDDAPMHRRLVPALVCLALVLTAACGGDDEEPPSTTAPTTSTTLPAMPADFDWWHPTARVPLGGGWTFGACEGDDPSLCYEHPDGRHGIVELFRLNAGPDFDLNDWAARFVSDFVDDRTKGCGASYRVEAEPIEALDLPDGPVRRYGFAGGAEGAPNTERTIQWAGVRGDGVLVIVVLSGYDPGSCVAGEGEGTLQDQEEVVPGIQALLLASGLPDPGGP
jgi:hypothetical protein